MDELKKTLILNCGSSSVKFQLLSMKDESVIAKGLVEKIGTSSAIVSMKNFRENTFRESKEILNHTQALSAVIRCLGHPNYGVLESSQEISAVGHRVVHGGERFSGSVKLTSQVIEDITNCVELAPLHNPANLSGISAAMALLPNAFQAAVFDTAFHQLMPKSAYMYGLPYEIYKKHGVRRYGFHGTSHYYVSREAGDLLDKPVQQLKMITCHLGNGASIAAVKYGISVDTSMGFTPLEGLVMGTRCGDIDPAILPYIIEKENLSLEGANMMMNKHSGLLGISKLSSDMRDLIEERENGEENAALAVDVYCYRIKKYIGAYAAAMGGTDAVIFTGGIGENAPLVRTLSLDGLDYMGIEIDKEKNEKNDIFISKGPVKVLVIPTNEELTIARETMKILENEQINQ